MKTLKECINKAPCKYCYQREDGGKDLSYVEVDVGAFGSIEAGINMTVRPFSSSETGGRMQLWVICADGNIDTFDNAAIRYCPFCGRDLLEEME